MTFTSLLCKIEDGYHFCCCLVTKLCPNFATPWTVALQAPLSMDFPRQEYWSELPSPSPGDLRSPGIKPMSPALAGGFFITEPPGKPQNMATSTNESGLLKCFAESAITVAADLVNTLLFCSILPDLVCFSTED